jgi:glutamine synthetase
MDRQDTAYVLKRVRDHNVKFVRLWFTDILGFLKNIAIVVDELEEALSEGIGFDGSAIEGYVRIEESDMLAIPDPSTFQILPWRSRDGFAVARMFCDIYHPDLRPYEGDPRWVLRKTLQEAYELGFTFYVGPEIEFFYFKDSTAPPKPLDTAGFYDISQPDFASDLRGETVLTLKKMGIEVEYSHHEGAPSQHEIDLRYTDALTMADHIMTSRLVVKEVAAQNGYFASFMPKPFAEHNGSGMHTHMSLFHGEQNVFVNEKQPQKLSQLGLHFIAGLIRHAPEFTLLTNQWVNSYKRLLLGFDAPTYIGWGYRNRAPLLRIPADKPGRPETMRVEHRGSDVMVNPYLIYATFLAAGLEGIKQEYPPVEPIEGDIESMSSVERERKNIKRVPSDLQEAILVASQSYLLRHTLGAHVFDKLMENKGLEWQRFMAHITDYEYSRYLPLL